MTHGGNVYQASDETGIPVKDILDFSASINPLGVPDSVAAAIRDNIGLLVHYPDPFADGLGRNLAHYLGVDHATILCGNGSTELIYLLARSLRPRRILIPAPTFAEYERACLMNEGSSCVRLELSSREGFSIDPDRFMNAMTGCDMAFLCNPNNPTGRMLDRETVLRIARAAGDANCFLVLDEAFTDFMPGQSLVRDVAGNSHLLVLRSLTKFYALSGLRIGCGVFPGGLVEQLGKYKEPWTVNTLAQVAARTALEDRAYQERTMDLIAKEKEYLEPNFKKLGIEFFPSAANYYLLRTDRSREIISALKKKGILVRDCSNFAGLDDSFIRIAVRSREENSRLLKEFGDLCAE